MLISIEWLDGGVNSADEERATLAGWRVSLNGQNVCLHLDGSDSVDRVTSPLYSLAEAVAHRWWALFGGRDRHVGFAEHRMGYAVPDIRMEFDGLAFEVSARQRTYRNPDIRFWAGPSQTLRRGEAEAVLSGFVRDVLDRLLARNVTGTALERRWARVSASRADIEEALFCEAAGALGVDPYAIDDADARLIEQAAKLFDGEPLLEFLSGLRAGVDRANRALEWVEAAEGRPRYKSRLPRLRDAARKTAVSAPARPGEPAWALGYRRARGARVELGLHPARAFRSYKDAAQAFGAPHFALAAPVDGLAALRSDHDDGVYIHLRGLGRSRTADASHTFAFARAVGDAICFPDGGRSVVNELHVAARQAAGRAFAAEFLAPAEEVLALRREGRDIARIAQDYAVSATVVERQLENVDRIRSACR